MCAGTRSHSSISYSEESHVSLVSNAVLKLRRDSEQEVCCSSTLASDDASGVSSHGWLRHISSALLASEPLLDVLAATFTDAGYCNAGRRIWPLPVYWSGFHSPQGTRHLDLAKSTFRPNRPVASGESKPGSGPGTSAMRTVAHT